MATQTTAPAAGGTPLPALEFENVLYEKDEGIAYVTFNRPAVLNALNGPTLADLRAALEDARDDQARLLLHHSPEPGTLGRSLSRGPSNLGDGAADEQPAKIALPRRTATSDTNPPTRSTTTTTDSTIRSRVRSVTPVGSAAAGLTAPTLTQPRSVRDRARATPGRR